MNDDELKNWRIEIRTRMMLNNVTATQVAKKMGVSVQFISSSLTGYRASVSDKTRQKISKTVEKLIKQG